MLSLRNLVGHHWDSNMGGGVHPTKCMGTLLKRMRTLLRQFGQVELLMQSLWNLHGAFRIRHWSPINATESKKWMQYPSIMISKSFMGGIFPNFFFNFKNIVCILTLECNFFFCFLVLGFEAQQRRLLLQMQFNLRLSIVNYLLITMQPKL